MTEPWRIKKFYGPRVLIDVARVQNSTFPDSIVCLAGRDFEMLRNLTAYLHRRSTWVSEYRENDYLAPTNEEWDELQGYVADLEDVLMGCVELTNILQQIADGVACLCNRESEQPVYTPATTSIVNYFETEGGLSPADPYDPMAVLDVQRCAVAQLVHQAAYEWLTEIVQPAQDKATDILLPLAMVAVATWVGPSTFNIPTGTALAALWHAVEVWERGELENVANTLLSIKEEITCAVYNALTDDFKAGAAAARAVINQQDLAPGDKICLGILCGSWQIAACRQAWEAQTAWAVANVDPDYCEICDEPEWPFTRLDLWPPCPGTWTGGFPCSSRSLPGINEDYVAYSPTFGLPGVGLDVIIDITCEWYSSEASGWTVGYVVFQEWKPATEEWIDRFTFAATNSQPPGTIQNDVQTSPATHVEFNSFRLKLAGQLGQPAVDPYPFEPTYVSLGVYEV